MYKNFLDKVIEDPIFDAFLNYKLDEKKYSLDIDNIVKYQEDVKSNKHNTDFFLKILEKSAFLSYEMFVEAINLNCSQIKEISEISTNKIVLYLDTGAYKKSNFFYTVLTYFKLNQLGITIDGIINDIKKYNGYIKDTVNKYYLIICDDVSYSGNQLLGHLYIGKEKFKDNANIYLNIIGYTQKAYNTFALDFNEIDIVYPPKNNAEQLIIGKGAKLLNNNMEDIIKELTNNNIYNIELYNHYDLEINSENINNSVIEKKIIFPLNDLETAIILFQKYPDYISTYQHLCYLRHYNSKYTLNLYNLINLFEIELDSYLNFSNMNDLILQIRELLTKQNKLESKIILFNKLESIIEPAFKNDIPPEDLTQDLIMSKINGLFVIPIIEKPETITETVKYISFTDESIGIKSINTVYMQNTKIKFSDSGDFCKQISINSFYQHIPYFFIDAIKRQSLEDLRALNALNDLDAFIINADYKKKYIKYKEKYIKYKKIYL